MSSSVTEPDASPRERTATENGKLRRGGRLIAMSQAFVLGTQLIVSLVLARLLSPSTFGVFNVVLLVTLFVETVLLNLGTGVALVQRPQVTERMISSVFWFNLMVGLACAGTVVATAGWLAPLLGSERAVGPLRLTALYLVFGALGAVPRAMLRRQLRFTPLAVSNLCNGLVNAALSVVLVAVGMGVWGLALANVASTAVGTGIMLATCRWRPRRTFDRAELKVLRNFGANYTGYQVLSYFYTAGDRLIVGQLNERALGLYSQSNRLMMYPARLISSVMGDVMLPGFARMQDNHSRLRRAFIDVVVTVNALLIPPLVTLGVLAVPFTHGVLGPKWEDAAPLFPLLAASWGLATLTRLPGGVLQAMGRADLMLRWAFISTVVTMGGYLVGARWDVLGVSWGFFITTFVLTFPNMAVACHLIELPLGRLFSENLPFLLAGVGQGGVQWLAMTYLHRHDVGELTTLLVAGPVGVLIYAGLAALLAPKVVARLLASRRRTVRIDVGDGTEGVAPA